MTAPTTKVRAVEQSLFPDIAPDRPVGPILPSVFIGSNADLIAACAPYYLTGSVLDITYGEGGWWQRFVPDPFTAHDLKLDGVDFRALPEPDASVDTVTFDPPYIPQGGVETSTLPKGARSGPAGGETADFLRRFGLTRSRSESELWALIGAGLAEAARVSSRFVLVKCMDFVQGPGLTLGHRLVLDMADELGMVCHDLIVHNTGSGPGGHNIFDPKRARRHHSYLLVFTHRGGTR